MKPKTYQVEKTDIVALFFIFAGSLESINTLTILEYLVIILSPEYFL